MAEKIRVSCPSCLSVVNAPAAVLGKKVKCNKCGERFIAEPVVEKAPPESDEFDFGGIDEPAAVVTPARSPRSTDSDVYDSTPSSERRPWQLRYSIFVLCRLIPTLCVLAFALTLVGVLFMIAIEFGVSDSKGSGAGTMMSIIYSLSVLFSVSLTGSFSYGMGSLVDHVAEIRDRLRMAGA